MDIRRDRPSDFPFVRPAERDEDHPDRSPSNARPISGAAVGFGAVSLVIGLIAVFFATGLSFCCFVFGWATVPFSAIGLTLGVIGLIIPLATKSRGIALPIAGASVNALALLIVLAAQVFGIAYFTRAAPAPMSQPAPQPTPGMGIENLTPISSFTQGDVKVTVLKAQREANRLVIHLQVENLSKENKVTFKTWSVPEANGGAASLKDEVQNDYALLDAKGGKPVAAPQPEQTINPGVSLDDVLYFEPPDEKFVTLTLRVPAANFKAIGRMSFLIPRDKVQN